MCDALIRCGLGRRNGSCWFIVVVGNSYPHSTAHVGSGLAALSLEGPGQLPGLFFSRDNTSGGAGDARYLLEPAWRRP